MFNQLLFSFACRVIQVVKLGIVVAVTFTLCFLPFLTSVDSILQVFVRMFPFNRGLFEDKVANFWCAISVLIKIRNMFSIPTLSKIRCVLHLKMLHPKLRHKHATSLLKSPSLGATLAASLPPGVHLALHPTVDHFLYALVNVALAFFAFSFQVHEKSILLAIMPMLLLVSKERHFVRWFVVLANFSMFPLLKKDGLTAAYFAVNLLWLRLTYDPAVKTTWLQRNFYRLTYVVMAAIHLLDWFVPPSCPPPRPLRCDESPALGFLCKSSLSHSPRCLGYIDLHPRVF